MSTRTTTTTNRGSSTTSTTLSSPSSIIVCSAMASVPLSAAVSSISANLPAYAPSILGGLSIGLLAVAQLAIGGRVLGISGAVRGIVSAPLAMDRNQVFRYLFVCGLLAGGILLPYLPGGATATAASLSASRVATAGLLVGVGTSLSNGCTSGHGICGMSRLSARSILSTCIFMLFGALAVSLLSGAQSVGLPAGFIVPAVDQALTKLATGVFYSTVAFLGAVTAAIKASASDGGKSVPALENVANFGTGVLFALGLAVSGMLDAGKVIGFLSILSGTWDASLAFVMGGALCVSLPLYQLVLSKFGMRQPLACDAFNLPSTKEITTSLVTGSAIFGVGWGLAGVCPGPALANLNGLFVATMAVGMLLTTNAKKLRPAA